jgi:excisionase family DNA binding protein
MDQIALSLSALRGNNVNSPSMTVHDVAVYLKVDDKTVYRLAQRRDLPGFKVAGTWRFKRQDIDAWIERQKERVAEKKCDGEIE